VLLHHWLLQLCEGEGRKVFIYVANKTKAKGFTMLNIQEKPDPPFAR